MSSKAVGAFRIGIPISQMSSLGRTAIDPRPRRESTVGNPALDHAPVLPESYPHAAANQIHELSL
jgi:hypothetical protein